MLVLATESSQKSGAKGNLTKSDDGKAIAVCPDRMIVGVDDSPMGRVYITHTRQNRGMNWSSDRFL